MDKYIPSHNFIKNMRSPLEVPEQQTYCDVHYIAEPLIELQSRQLWRLIKFWVDVQTIDPNLSEVCRQATKVLLLFPAAYRCEAVFQRCDYFKKQALIPTSTRKRHQVMCVDDHKPLFRQTGETNSETRSSMKFLNVGDKPNLLKLVFASFS